MILNQLIARGVSDPRVLDVMRRVPRHAFVPAPLRAAAYEDRPLRIGSGQTISQPYMVAAMTELLRVEPDSLVLEIGTGSGYQSAILSLLARHVVTMERIDALAKEAAGRLSSLGYHNVTVLTGDGTLGAPDEALYDAIVVTAGAPHVPLALKEQLAPGARLVCPVGSERMQKLIIITRTPGHFLEEQGFACTFVPLIGYDGWKA